MRLSAVKVFLLFLQLTSSVFQLLSRDLHLCLSGVQLLLFFVEQSFRVCDLSLTVLQLSSSTVQICLVGIYLFPGVGHLLFPGSNLLPAVLKLLFPICDRILRVGNLLLTVSDLIPCILKFLLRIRHFLSGVFQFLPSILIDRLIPAVTGVAGDIFQPVENRCNLLLIFRAEAVQIPGAFHLNISLRIDIALFKNLGQHDEKRIDTSVPDHSGTAVHLHIVGKRSAADDRIRLFLQCLRKIVGRPGLQRHSIPDLTSGLLQVKVIRETLILFLRQSALREVDLVDILHQTDDFQGELHIVLFIEDFRRIPSGGVFHPFGVPHIFQVILRQSQSAYDLNIHKIHIIIIAVRRLPHIIFTGTDSGEKRRTQHDDKQHREKTALVSADLPKEIPLKCFHSLHLTIQSVPPASDVHSIPCWPLFRS